LQLSDRLQDHFPSSVPGHITARDHIVSNCAVRKMSMSALRGPRFESFVADPARLIVIMTQFLARTQCCPTLDR
jgi:hypothetical protein